MNVYRIIAYDFHDIFSQQDSEATGFVVGLADHQSKAETIIMNPHKGTVQLEGKGYPDSVPGTSAEFSHGNHAVPDTSEVSCMH
jgi:hypothetical protein